MLHMLCFIFYYTPPGGTMEPLGSIKVSKEVHLNRLEAVYEIHLNRALLEGTATFSVVQNHSGRY